MRHSSQVLFGAGSPESGGRRWEMGIRDANEGDRYAKKLADFQFPT